MPDDFDDDEDILNEEELSAEDLADVVEQRERKVGIESPRPNSVPVQSQDSGGSTGAAAARAKIEEEPGPLFSGDEANNLRARWDRVQVGFVDEPRQAVEEADMLVAQTMERLTDIFVEERQRLEKQWDKGDTVSTEDLRVALRRYRSFFSRLLKI